MKKFFETACTILLFAALLIMVGNYFENKAEEPVEETPVTEKEIITVFFNTTGISSISMMECQYYDGITWGEFIVLNDIPNMTTNENDELILETYNYKYYYNNEESDEVVYASDLVIIEWGGNAYYVTSLVSRPMS